MAAFYSHQNPSVTSTQSSGSRRLSAHNPFRQAQSQMTGATPGTVYKNSFGSNSTPTINETDSSGQIRTSVNPKQFEAWIQKNQELETLSDDDQNEFDFVDTNVFIKPPAPRPSVPQRAGSDSSVIIHRSNTLTPQGTSNSRMSNYANNPFADALSTTSTASSTQQQQQQQQPRRTISTSPPTRYDQAPRSYTKSVPPPVNRASKDLPPPSYEEAAGPEAAKAPYRDEKPADGSSRTHRSSHRHRSHSDGEHKSRSHGSSAKSSSRHHHSSRNGTSSSRSKSEKKSKEAVKPKNLDTIDKLDVTGLFGGGFHHDGPFEACTPHRNQNKKAAPVAAFPVDGPNSSIKGAGHSIKEELIDYAFGVPNDGQQFGPSATSKSGVQSNGAVNGSASVSTRNGVPPARQMYSNGASNPSRSTIHAIKNDMSVIQFDSNTNSQPVHGQTSLGLGSSTFVDGAPAPKAAVLEEANHQSSGLGRKKSLVHRVKSIRRKN